MAGRANQAVFHLRQGACLRMFSANQNSFAADVESMRGSATMDTLGG